MYCPGGETQWAVRQAYRRRRFTPVPVCPDGGTTAGTHPA